MGSRGRKSSAELAVLRPPAPDPESSRAQPAPPDHLSVATQAWWRALVADFEIEPHQLGTLQLAAEAWDRKEQAREALTKHGLTFCDDRGMIRARPEVAVERDSRVGYLRALRELRLDVEPPKPPRVGGIGVLNRWNPVA